MNQEKPLNPAQRITAYLKAHAAPISRAALKDALANDVDRKTITDRLHRQIERGMVGTDGVNVWHVRDRSHRKPELTKEEKRLRKRARENAQRRALGIPSRDENNAARAKASAARKAAAKQARLDAKRAQREALQREREAVAAAKLAKMVARLTADNAQKRRQAKAKAAKQENAAAANREGARAVKARVSDAMASAPAKHADFPDTEAFIRANPGKYEVLRPGEWSAPLRFTY